ncbi:MAG TPA: ribonuclease III [Firmicutes bacterium]|nr:ribonuclease III [Bacillota bacterium]
MLEQKAVQLNPLTLAFVGDGVYNLFVRTYAVEHMDVKASRMNAYCRDFVKATAQAKAYRAIEGELTETEAAVAHRARNSHPYNKAKNASSADYMHATALEAVIGYLYVSGQRERLEYIEKRAMEESV